MSSDASATKPASNVKNPDATTDAAPALDKGKGKRTATEADIDSDEERKAPARNGAADDDDEEEDDDDDDDDEEEEEEDQDDEEDEEEYQEIDPMAIRSRRTRGVKVDYTSPEALAKAGLKGDEADDDE